MKKLVLSLFALACVFTLTTGLHAQERATIAHIDEAFVVDGQTFEAGTYEFVPDSPGSRLLTIRSKDGASARFVLATTFDGASPDRIHVTFRRVDGVNYLSEIASADGVYTLAPSRTLMVAKANDRSGSASLGTN